MLNFIIVIIIIAGIGFLRILTGDLTHVTATYLRRRHPLRAPLFALQDAMASAVLEEDSASWTYSELAKSVRLLQEYELAFWDACYAAV